MIAAPDVRARCRRTVRAAVLLFAVLVVLILVALAALVLLLRTDVMAYAFSG